MKIVITGPECSGKTTLVNALSHHLSCEHVHEVAREYLNIRNNQYDISNLDEIALLQRWAEKSKADLPLVVCDTDLLTIIIWKLEKYQIEDHDLIKLWLDTKVDMFFLCTPDIPWEYDPMRENPNDRERLFNIYEKYLLHYKQPYRVLKGNRALRLTEVIDYIQS